MGKRQKRFSGETITSKEISGKEVNLIKKDGSVFHIKILEIDPGYILGEDLRKKKLKFSLNEIYEIILDFPAAY